MKKHISILLLFALFASCKKDKQQQSQLTDKGYPVSFSITGFSSVIVPINNNSKIKVNDATTDTLPFKYIYYKIYKNATSASFHSIAQGVLAPNLGHFNDTVPPGQYIVTITGANLPLSFTTPTDTAFHIGSNVNVPNRDLFFKKYTLNVTGSIPQQNIVLDRIVAQVEVNIEDAIPASVASISISYKDLYFFSTVRNAAPFKSAGSSLDGLSGVYDLGTVTQNITAADVGTTNYKIRGFIDDTVNPVTITIKAGGVTRVIPNIKFTKNTKTILTGKLFTGAASSFAVSYNPVYSTDTIRVGL
jgi:hypothetical protein